MGYRRQWKIGAIAIAFFRAQRIGCFGVSYHYGCNVVAITDRYMTRKPLPDRRHTWRQKVSILDNEVGEQTFYVEFGEYPDGTLGEVFITAKRYGTFTRGVLDTLARSISLGLQSGTSPHDVARQLRWQNYPPCGPVEAEGSGVTECTSLADYIGQEIVAVYDEDGKRRVPPDLPERPVGHAPEDWRMGV